MILTALNGDKLEKFGYREQIGMKKENWHGHQVGIAIGALDYYTQEIKQNYLGNNGTNEDLMDIINDSSILLITKKMNYILENEAHTLIIYYLPYAVNDHSIFRESLNFANIIVGELNHVKAEVLLNVDGLNRYFIASYDTKDESVYDVINNLNIFKSLFESDIVTNQENESFTLDFYNEAGEQTMVEFNNIESLRQCITSVRLLEVDTEIGTD